VICEPHYYAKMAQTVDDSIFADRDRSRTPSDRAIASMDIVFSSLIQVICNPLHISFAPQSRNDFLRI